MHPNDTELVLAVYLHALAVLEIRHVEIRRDYLAGAHIEAVADFRNEGLVEQDAEKRADLLIEQTMLMMANGKDWLRHRVSICERL